MLLAACDLPAEWAGQAQWRILEVGFGLAGEFLPAWQAWREDPQRPRLLHHVAVEASPCKAEDLGRAYASRPELQPLAEALCAQWQGLLPGFHRLAFEEGRVLLTLCVGDVATMLREQAFRADTVFLGGATPELPTLKAVTRLCRRGTTLVTAARAAQVRPALEACGWQAAPERDDALVMRLDPSWPVRDLVEEGPTAPARAVVIGAGLAGAAVAASLARRGWSVLVVDAAQQPAAGASSLPAGLLAPHQSPDDNLLSRLSRAGVRVTLQQAQQRLAAGLEWERTGVLESRGDDQRPLPAVGDALAVWSREASEAQKRAAGLAPAAAAWWHETAAWIEPAALVRSWLREPRVRFMGGWKVQGITRHGERLVVTDDTGTRVAEVELVVVAAALESKSLLGDRIQMQPVRGQVTWAPRGGDVSALPPFPVNGNGHFLPRVPLVERGAWITGSTYGRGDGDPSGRAEDEAANLERLRQLMPQAGAMASEAAARGETRSWSGVRCASTDRRPLVGKVEAGLWVSTAMGSRGLTFAALCAELLAARLHGEPLPVEARLAQAVAATRQAGR
jgi:tRNA 5-methylaminomethyl-2-thiouridine biosynthesis bifunctional protein